MVRFGIFTPNSHNKTPKQLISPNLTIACRVQIKDHQGIRSDVADEISPEC